MPAANVSVGNPSGTIPLTVALTEVVFSGPSIDVAYINADADIYLVLSPTLSTGDAIIDQKYRIPAGIAHPIRVYKSRVLLASVTGTANAWVLAIPKEPLDKANPSDPCR